MNKFITLLQLLLILLIFTSCDVKPMTTTPTAGPIIKWESKILSAPITFGYDIFKTIGDRNYIFYGLDAGTIRSPEGTQDDLYLGIAILDVSEPDKPIEIGYLRSGNERYNEINGLALYGTTLYAATNDYLWLIDISDLHNPKEIRKESSLASNSIEVSGHHAYTVLLNNTWTISTLDISDSINPKVVGSLELQHEIIRLGSSGSILYALSPRELSIVDISIPEHINAMGSISNPFPPHTGTIPPGGLFVFPNFFDMAIADKYVFIISGVKKMLAIDTSNPQIPTILATLDTKVQGMSIIVSDKYVYLLPRTGMLKTSDVISIIDISSPAIPIQLSKSLKLEGIGTPDEDITGKSFKSMALVNGYLYLASMIVPGIEIIKLY